MGVINTDTSQWPIVVHTQEGAMGPDDTTIFLHRLDEVLARRQRYVTVFDSTKLSTFKMGDRDRIVQWLKENDAQLKQYSVGTGVVLASAALRFVISGVLLVYRPPTPIKVFGSMAEAMAWAKTQVTSPVLRPAAERV